MRITAGIADQAALIDRLSVTVGNQIAPPRAGCETWCTAWSPDGGYFAWSCGNRIVKLIPWNRYEHKIIHPNDYTADHGLVVIDTGELVWAMAFGSPHAETKPHSVALNWKKYTYHSNKNLILATGGTSGKIRTWNVATGQLLLILMDHREVIRDLRFAPDGSLRPASASRDSSLKLWDMQDDGNMFRTLKGDSKWLYGCAWSPDANMLVSVGDGKSVLLWDTHTFERRKLTGHFHDVVSCDFSPDGALLATSSYDTRVIIWDPHTAEMLITLGHLFPPPSAIFAGGANGSYVRDVSFSHDGRHVASVADDGYVRFWDIVDHHAPVQYATMSDMLCCQYSPDGVVLAVGTRDGSISFWQSPLNVQSLQHMCRMAIRRNIGSQGVSKLEMPTRLMNFLTYKD